MMTRRQHVGLLASGLLGPVYAARAMAAEPAPSGGQWVHVHMDRFYVAVSYVSGPTVDAKTHAIIQTFFNLKIPFVPLPPGIVDTRYDPSLNVVCWNASAAVQVASDAGTGTGKYISPALLFLGAIAHAVAHAQSAPGYANLASSPDPMFGTLEQRRVIAGLSRSDMLGKLHDQTPSAIADADKILAIPNQNGMENAVAPALGEPVRTNTTLVLQDGKIVEGVTYVTVDNPTWHRN